MWQDIECGWTLHVAGPYMWQDIECGWTLHVAGPYMWQDIECGMTLHCVVAGPDMWLDLTCDWTFHVAGPWAWQDIGCGRTLGVAGHWSAWTNSVEATTPKAAEMYVGQKQRVFFVVRQHLCAIKP